MRDEELPEELSRLGSQALDVAAYRAWPALHPFVAALWAELGVKTGCYSDIAFRTGDCTSEVCTLYNSEPLMATLTRTSPPA